MKDKELLLTGKLESHLRDYNGWQIHKDVVIPLEKLQLAAKEEIGSDLKLISTFRSFDRQLNIWNAKASGKRVIKDEFGNQVDIKKLSQEELFLVIARFSAIPGASRHHWGTDFDIYDANEIDKEDLKLEPDEYEKGGPCYKLSSWLEEKVLTDESFGFYRPYNIDRGGVYIEKWHVSYAPIANKYCELYTLDLFTEHVQNSEILLKDYILENASKIYMKYVQNC